MAITYTKSGKLVYMAQQGNGTSSIDWSAPLSGWFMWTSYSLRENPFENIGFTIIAMDPTLSLAGSIDPARHRHLHVYFLVVASLCWGNHDRLPQHLRLRL